VTRAPRDQLAAGPLVGEQRPLHRRQAVVDQLAGDPLRRPVPDRPGRAPIQGRPRRVPLGGPDARGLRPQDRALPPRRDVGLPGHHLGGSAGFADASVELEARSIDYGQTDAIIAALTNLFDGFQGNMAGITVMSSLVDSDGDDYDDADDGSDAGTFEDTITIAIRYRLPSPSI